MGNAIRSPDQAICDSTIQTVTSPWYLTILTIVGCSSFSATIISLIFVLRRRINVAFHPNVKILLMLMIIQCLVYSATYAVCSIMVMINLAIRGDSCNVLYLTRHCSVYRRIILTSFVGFTTTQSALIFERFVATIKRKAYENTGTLFGFAIAATSCFCSILPVLWALATEDPDETVTNCAAFSNSPSVAERVHYAFYLMISLEAVQLISFSSLYYINKRRTKITDSLSKKVQRNENYEVLSSIAPLILLKIAIVSTYVICAIYLRSLKNDMDPGMYKKWSYTIYIIPHYPLVTIMLLFLAVKNTARRRKTYIQKINNLRGKSQSDVYFKAYNW